MRYLLAAPLLLMASSAWAEPFSECPAKAFLTQGSVPSTYGVNLVTGDYQVVGDTMGVSRPVNGLGFNSNDNFLYGWSYEHGKPARVHDDFSVEPLETINIDNGNFYVGDVSIVENRYYVYRPGSSAGLYYISLDPSSSDYQQMVKVVSGRTLSLRIADMAFHPFTNLAYAVESNGNLQEINVQTGTSTQLANIGQTGTFGAAYFDPNGYLYVSRNNDGAIFRIGIDTAEYDAIYFATGPSSSTNDGSRCALAPIIDASNTDLDFGDAPDSYGTSMANNGARHGLANSDGFYLGNFVDGESDASFHPLSDDENGENPDDDGIQFANNIVESSNAIAKVTAQGDNGFLNGWIDLNQNSTFEADEQVAKDVALSSGQQYVYMPIPAGVIGGETWARFRYSSAEGVQPVGGAPDGEVEDYKVQVIEREATVTNYPSSHGWTTVAFEDNWPYEGDYDMNDLVVQMRTSVWAKSRGVTQINMKGEITAVGAAYHNGFAVRLPGVSPEQVNKENITFEINGRDADFSPMETDRDEAIFIITHNVWDYVGAGNFCKYYRTEPGCGSDIQMSFSIQIPLVEPVDVELSGVFDPFLFATPGAWHGGHFVSAPGRSYEIHLKNQSPTEVFDYSLFEEAGEDVSSPTNNHYYLTEKGLPWAMEIGTQWSHPQEYRDISHAYPYFAPWTQSDGQTNKDWYLLSNANAPLLFEN